MNTTNISDSERVPTGLALVGHLSAVLAKVEASTQRLHADQYQVLIAMLKSLLQDAPRGGELAALLDHFPATAQLYENMNYVHAGLCRAPLGTSVETERQAATAIARAMKPATAAPGIQTA